MTPVSQKRTWSSISPAADGSSCAFKRAMPERGFGTNRYRCVSQNGRKWKARIPGNSPKGWVGYIGTFDDEEEAARAVAKSEVMLANGVPVDQIVALLRPVPDKTRKAKTPTCDEQLNWESAE